MKNFLKVTAILFCVLSLSEAQAQHKKEKIEALRVAYITNKLELSPAEAEKFWPVYNEFHYKMKDIRRSVKDAYKKMPERLTEAEAKELYALELKSKKEELELFTNYTEKLKIAIGVVKLAKLRIAEDQFRHEMIKAID